MLSQEHIQKLDEAGEYHAFQKSKFHKVLQQILEDYRLNAIREMERADRVSPETSLELVLRLHAANDLKRHIEMTIQDKLEQVQEVADEVGVDLDELRIRSEIANVQDE